MAASCVVQKGVVNTLPPVPKFPFHAVIFSEMEEGVNKLYLHLWNEVPSRVDSNLKAIKLKKVPSMLLKISNLFFKERRKFILNIDG